MSKTQLLESKFPEFLIWRLLSFVRRWHYLKGIWTPFSPASFEISVLSTSQLLDTVLQLRLHLPLEIRRNRHLQKSSLLLFASWVPSWRTSTWTYLVFARVLLIWTLFEFAFRRRHSQTLWPHATFFLQPSRQKPSMAVLQDPHWSSSVCEVITPFSKISQWR